MIKRAKDSLRKWSEAPRIRDLVSISGAFRSKQGGGISSLGGDPVPVETIMREFGVSRERAVLLRKRVSA